MDHVDDEAEVDVEQCSDSEALSRSRTPRTTASNNSRATPTSDEERLTPEPVKLNLKYLYFIFFTKINRFNIYRVVPRYLVRAIQKICDPFNVIWRQRNYGINFMI